MDNRLVYRPYSSAKRFLTFMYLFELCPIAFLVVNMFYCNIKGIIFAACIAFMNFIAILMSRIAVSIAFIFTNDGIELFGKWKGRTFIAWDSLKYGYIGNSYKNFLCVVLAPEKLSSNKVRNLSVRGADRIEPIIEEYVVIYMPSPESPESMAVLKYIQKRVEFL